MNCIKIPAALFLLAVCGGCTNSFLGRLASTVTVSPTPTSTASTTTDTLIISSVTINVNGANSPNPTTSGPGGSSSTALSTLFFDSVHSTSPVSSHCNVASSGQTSKPCLCQFTWAEVNPNSGSTVPTPRNVQTPVTQVQPNLINCNAPPIYSSEIISGTQIKITVLAAPGNPDATSFTTTPYRYVVSPTTLTGSFQDSQGQIFDNIVHYSCYNKYSRGLSIQSKINPITNSGSGTTTAALYASRFCLTAGGGTASASTACPSLASASNSAQSYYFNLYIRNSEKGDINKFNDGFVCPTVQEPLSGTTTPASIGTAGQFWPMDTTFALSLGATQNFSVGVQSNTKLSGGAGEQTAANSQCYATSASAASASTSSIISSCLGFAAPVSSDGTCPYIRSASGQILQTYRLRRFVALYPRLFDTNGTPAAQAQPLDTVYVLDRPIKTSSTVNPLKPYTMLGPKPCPFAFFDVQNVASLRNTTTTAYVTPLGYRATNDPRWKTGDGTINWTQSWVKGGTTTYNNGGTNIDGLEFPNYDSANSCSAALPFPSADGTRFYMATVNKFRDGSATNPNAAKFNHLFIRPFKPFAPHYEEDTNFQACAPQSNPVRDAPLHFMASSSGTGYAWCAESYPSQNPNIAALDPPVTPTKAPTTPYADLATFKTGLVSPYTSHVSVLNATPALTSTACAATSIASSFPPAASYVYTSAGGSYGYALHSSSTTWGTGTADVTCDRTVVPTSNITWNSYPLLAPAADVENALKSDSSYNCTVTFDNAGGKAAALFSPKGGCCLFKNSALTGASHLEPSQGACLPPTY